MKLPQTPREGYRPPLRGKGPAGAGGQAPFALVAPALGAALLIGAGGGFVLASILGIARGLRVPPGRWWVALVQAHGHLQLYGWAGLFVLGVALHFVPRLRGAPLVYTRLVLPLTGLIVSGLLLRLLCQPLAGVSDHPIWRIGLGVSGVLEGAALLGIVALVAATFVGGPRLASRPALLSVLPLLACAFVGLTIAGPVIAIGLLAAAGNSALVPPTMDEMTVALGLFGFLVPVALAMSVRALPMYAGLEAFPARLRMIGSWMYIGGLALAAGGTALGGFLGGWAGGAHGLGMMLLGGALLLFAGVFIWLMRGRGRLPSRMATLAPSADEARQRYRSRVADEHGATGPFVGLVASAYLWAAVGGALLLFDGAAILLGSGAPVPVDAARHSVALGFVSLLLAGVAPRLLPGFSGGRILSPWLVRATLWLGNAAVALRVLPLLLPPLGPSGAINQLLFGLSGPLGLTFAICLAVNLWPAIFPTRRAV